MKYCAKCGNIIESGVDVCPECGYPVNEPASQPDGVYQQANNQQQGYYNNAYQQPFYPQPNPAAAMNSEIETANTLGIVSLVLSIIGGTLLTIAGLVTGIICMNKIKPFKNGDIFPNNQAKSAYSLGKAGMIVSIVKLSLGVILAIAWIVFIVVMGVGAVGGAFY